MKHAKNIICFSLILSILFCFAISPLTVHAIELPDYSADDEAKWNLIYGENNWHYDEELHMVQGNDIARKFHDFIMGGLGMSGEFGALSKIFGTKLVKNEIDKVVDDIKLENGKLTIPSSLMGNIYNALTNNLYPMNGYYILTSNTTRYAIKDKLNPSNSRYELWCSEIDSYYGLFVYSNSSRVYVYPVYDNTYVVFDNNLLRQMDSDFHYVTMEQIIYHRGSTESGSSYSAHGITDWFTIPYSYSGPAIKIYYTPNDIKHYNDSLTGAYTPDIFLSSNFYNYSPTNLTVDVNNYNKTDYTTINQNTYNKIVNERNSMIEYNGGSISEGVLQKVIDDSLAELKESIGNIEDNTGDISQDTAGILSVLNKINDTLTKIYDEVQTSFMDSIIDFIKNRLADIGDLIEGIVSSVIGNLFPELIKFFIGDGGVADAVLKPAKALASQAQTKFPTCIPWDIVAIINSFSAEPEVPKFELSFAIERLGIHETIVVDFEKADGLAKLSRSMFVITFLLFLVIQTRKLYGTMTAK